MPLIVVQIGAEIIEVTEGRGIPRIRTVGQIPIRTTGTLHTDHETGEQCYEFKFQGRNWTVDVNMVEVVS